MLRGSFKYRWKAIRSQSNPKKINKRQTAKIQTAHLNKNPQIPQTQIHSLIHRCLLRQVKHIHPPLILPQLHLERSLKKKKKTNIVLNQNIHQPDRQGHDLYPPAGHNPPGFEIGEYSYQLTDGQQNMRFWIVH